MKIPFYARYDYCINRSCEFLEEFNITQFPVDPFAIIKSNYWGIATYSEMAKECNCTIKEVIVSVKSEDARTVYNGNNYTIAYNDIKPKRRILFTLIHEIGHIYLNHLVDFENTEIYRGGLSKEENKVLENEANTFARNVLAPATFVELINDKSKYGLSKYFGLSYPAAKTRLDFLEYDIQYVKQIGIQLRLYRIFYLFYYRYGCRSCNAIIVIKNAKYCPICGDKRLKRGDGELKYTKYLYDTDNNGKLTICPTCKNEDIHEGDYCPICGRNLVNKCDYYEEGYHNSPSGCGKILLPNARFCPDCGLPSSFHQNQWLPEWKFEKDELEEAANNSERIVNTDVQLEDLKLIQSEWGKIIRELGGPIRASFRDTVVETGCESFLCIVFSDSANYAIGSRPTVVGELEEYIQKKYGKKIYFKARIRNTDERSDTIYVSDEELKEALHMDISIDD